MSSALHPATLPVNTLLVKCSEERFRGSGPGGQHRNKVETGVRLCHLPSGIIGQASERRNQEQNRQMALFRLRINLALELRYPWNQISELWQSRTRSGKLAINSSHQDFPAILAEALDALSCANQHVSEAATNLGISTSQLIKCLAKEPKALAQVNQVRAKAGQPKLKTNR